jgi:hypothetical protein
MTGGGARGGADGARQRWGCRCHVGRWISADGGGGTQESKLGFGLLRDSSPPAIEVIVGRGEAIGLAAEAPP